jgi:hypothetical protein
MWKSNIQIIVSWRWNYMKISTSYPYPVLYMNNDDYQKTSFSTKIDVKEEFGEVKIEAQFYLDNPEMKRLIENHSCAYLIHVECSQTCYRQMFETYQEHLEISIATHQLRGKIVLHSFVVAKETIHSYKNEYLSDWYKGIPLTFEKGNILAIGEAIETTLIDDYTEFLNLPSIVTVTKSLKNDYMDVDIYSNNITIYLPEYEYHQYAMSAHSPLKNTILAAVIVPALVYVFSKISEANADLEEYTWYQVLDKIFQENNYRLEDVGTDVLSPLKAAQLILRKPLKASFEEIEKVHRMED